MGLCSERKGMKGGVDQINSDFIYFVKFLTAFELFTPPNNACFHSFFNLAKHKR